MQWEKYDSKTKANRLIQKGMCERLAATCKVLPHSKRIQKHLGAKERNTTVSVYTRIAWKCIQWCFRGSQGWKRKNLSVIHMHKSRQAQQSRAFVSEGSGSLPVTVTSTDAEPVPILFVASHTYMPAMSYVTGPLKISTSSRSSAELGREPFKLERKKFKCINWTFVIMTDCTEFKGMFLRTISIETKRWEGWRRPDRWAEHSLCSNTNSHQSPLLSPLVHL